VNFWSGLLVAGTRQDFLTVAGRLPASPVTLERGAVHDLDPGDGVTGPLSGVSSSRT